jgi:hypothetical protein
MAHVRLLRFYELTVRNLCLAIARDQDVSGEGTVRVKLRQPALGASTLIY